MKKLFRLILLGRHEQPRADADRDTVIMTNGASGEALISRVMRMIEQEYKWDAVDPPLPGRDGPE